MKSSVRILAIALALAFLLLARSAFQDSTTANAEDIELKDGEASFADLIDGTQEAEYLGFNMDDGKTADVYFYIKSEDLGTQVTASTTNVTAASGVVTLNAGNAVAGTVATTSIATLLDGTNMYCSENGTGATSTVSWDSTPVQEPDQDDPVVALPAGWALDQDDLPGGVSVVDGDVTGCTRGDDLTAATTTPAARETMLLAIQKAKHDPENKRVQDANGGLYTYGDDDDAYTKLNPGLRYTHGTNEGSVGGPDRPLASVKATHVDSRDPANIVRTSLLTFVSNADGGEFQAVSDPRLEYGCRRYRRD